MQRFRFTTKRCALILVLACLCASGTVARGDIWSQFDQWDTHQDFPIISGGLTGSRDNGELQGGLVSSNEGNWDDVTLAWYIESQAGQAYPVQFRYNYYIEVDGPNPGKDISHLWFTVTEGVFEFMRGGDSIDNLWVIDLDNNKPLETEIEEFNGNPHVSADHALKIDDLDGSDRTKLLVSFESYNYPVWGDFYVKGGGGQLGNHFYNAGIGQEVSSEVVSFENNDSEPIIFGVFLGEKDIYFNQKVEDLYKVVTPNGFVPEPGFFAAMLGMGLMGGLIHGVRRKRRSAGQPTN